MIPAIFAVPSVVGAWSTWRHNPLYSARSTLRSAAVILFAVAGIVSLVVAAVNLTIDRSPSVAGGTMAVVIVFGALSLIFIIQAVATPTSAKLTVALPANAKLVHTHRRKIYKLPKFFAILLAGLILAIVIPGDCQVWRFGDRRLGSLAGSCSFAGRLCHGPEFRSVADSPGDESVGALAILAGTMEGLDQGSGRTPKDHASHIHTETRLAQTCVAMRHHCRGGPHFLPRLLVLQDPVHAVRLWRAIRKG
jgi:hypothetical protein